MRKEARAKVLTEPVNPRFGIFSPEISRATLDIRLFGLRAAPPQTAWPGCFVS